MSSSIPNSAVFLSDAPDEGAKKLKRAKTGGRTSAEEQREKGGEPWNCSVYEMFHYHLVDGDSHLDEIYKECVNGIRLCGQCKNEAAELVMEFLKDFQKKKEDARERLNEFVVDD